MEPLLGYKSKQFSALKKKEKKKRQIQFLCVLCLNLQLRQNCDLNSGGFSEDAACLSGPVTINIKPKMG